MALELIFFKVINTGHIVKKIIYRLEVNIIGYSSNTMF